MRVLIICPDIVDIKMAGVGIRYWELSQAIAPHHRVTLAIPNRTSLTSPAMAIVTYDPEGKTLRKLAAEADAVMVQGFIFHQFPFLKELDRPFIVDVYTPIVLENLEIHTVRTMALRKEVHERDLNVMLDQLRRGDFFVCANERQRDYWLGMLSSLGRLNPYNYQHDKTFRKLVAVVPFGLPEESPQHTRRALKGVVPGIAEDDRVILWGGGIWTWFDPIRLVEAMPEVVRAHPKARAVFWSSRHPNAESAEVMGAPMFHQWLVKRCKKLGLYQKSVFFHEQWVPYGERQNFLLEADVGVCLHQNIAETRLAFRTRLIDYIWTGLPMVVSKGDSLSETVEQFQLGKTVACGDVAQIAQALIEILSLPNPRESYRERFEAIRDQFTWKRAVQPLLSFLSNPRQAADKLVNTGLSASAHRASSTPGSP